MNIFKAYDIRGRYPEEVNEAFAYKIGRSIVHLLGAKKILVARDAREGSLELSQSLMKGIIDQGANVIFMDFSTTPMFYHFKIKKEFDAGIMITASHLPAGFNGMKFLREEKQIMGYEAGLKEVEALIESGELDKILLAEKKGLSENADYTDEYVEFVINSVPGNLKDQKVVIDGSDGMAGPFAKKILDKVGADYISLNCEFNLENASHGFNPLEDEARAQAKAKILETGAAFGAVFDADADRVAFLDEHGEFIPGDISIAIMVENITKPGDVVVHDLISGRALVDTINKMGCKSIPTAIGQINITKVFREHNARVGGEQSCHINFRENFGCEATLIALLNMINILNKTGAKMSELVNPLKESWLKSGELNYEMESNEQKEKKIDEVKEKFSDGTLNFEDGVKVDYEDSWLNVRKSNTEPLLRLRIEANSKERLEEIKARVEKVILG
jgi:phosphomannomutase